MGQLLQSDARSNGDAAAAQDSDIPVHLFRLLNAGRPAPQSSFLPIAQDLPIAVYITDSDGFVVYHNAAATALWGRDPGPGEVRWCGSKALFNRDHVPLAHADSPMAQVGCNGFGAASEIIAQRQDGKRYTFVPHSTALTDAAGCVVGAIHLILDVSDRDRSEQETQRLAAIVESSDDAIISKQLDGTITSWNRAAERLFGYTADEIIGESVMMLIPDERHSEEAEIIGRIRRGERLEHFETQRRHKSGALIDISLTVSPIKRSSDGTIVGASKIARDISQKKHAEDLLQQQSERLETLNRVSRIISQDLDLDRIVQAVTDEATAVSGAQFGAFFYNVIDAAGETYFLYSLSGVPREAFDKFGMPRNTAVFAPTFGGEGVVRSADIRKDPRYGKNKPHYGMPAGHLPVVSYLAVPVISSSGEVIGGLFFGHAEPDRFAPETEALITAIAGQAAVAIDNARLHSAAQNEIAQRKKAEDARELLLHEVKHRVKNTLATIQALATQTLKGVPAAEKDAFISRLHALSDAHDLLTLSDWQDIGITSLVGKTLKPFSQKGEARVACDGPDVGLSANKALLLTMVLHELGTNAVKYGALSVEQGRVAIDWQMAVAERPTLRLEWRERGGPPTAAPNHRGFGSRMIASALHGSDGHVEFDYRPEGLRVALDMVL
ncbi:PAS domain S-box protein [Novosphingobium sp. G106]|uniref:PAS domain S-box protein n=1 Tax=Novosphingobium sp. G106 TaxID=2849500 RepID=UPI001C2DC472|nr:PAS domain S-box protein [Novosphingobium sp. G106]MBV1690547.1 PAS domain S-box protein [Novosphingobium sp. G106]